MLDIKNEALNLRIGEETQQNWWSATFDKVDEVAASTVQPLWRDKCWKCLLLAHIQIDALEIKSNAVRRENADPGGRGTPTLSSVFPCQYPAALTSVYHVSVVPTGAAAKQAQAARRPAPPIPTPTSPSPSEIGTEGAVAAVAAMAESPNTNGTSGQEAVVASMLQQMKIPGAATATAAAKAEKKLRDAAAPDEDTYVAVAVPCDVWYCSVPLGMLHLPTIAPDQCASLSVILACLLWNRLCRDDSDIDDLPPTPGTVRSSAVAGGMSSPSGIGAALSPRRARENSASGPSGAVHALPGRRSQALTSTAHEKKKRKFKLVRKQM